MMERLLLIQFEWDENSRNTPTIIRIISARKATKREIATYEKGI
jgi:uncharacterized DUF497 family protein